VHLTRSLSNSCPFTSSRHFSLSRFLTIGPQP